MASYSRALLVFAHAALEADPRWEAYCFGTRLTRLTRVLGKTDPDEALRQAASEVFDWDGGTRIGESLKRFLMTSPGDRPWLRRDHLLGRPRGRGSTPAGRADGTALTSRVQIIWLNPLKEDPAYEPLARGMSACLPYIDLFISGHNLASLEGLGEELARM